MGARKKGKTDDEANLAHASGGLCLHDLERHTLGELRAWCREFGLDATGPRARVVERLRAFIDVEFPSVEIEILPDEEVLGLAVDDLRALAERYGLETEGTAGQLASWLLWFFEDARRDVGPLETHTREELKGMPVEQLRWLCGMWNVSRKGRPQDLVYRILCRQGTAWPPAGRTGHPIEPPPNVVIREG